MKVKFVGLMVLNALITVAQSNVTGKVTDAKYQPLVGVRVQLADGRTVSTNAIGVFKFNDITPNEILTIDQPGYGIIQVTVPERRGKLDMPKAFDTLRVVLPLSSKKLDEVACITIRLAPEATNVTKLDKQGLNAKNYGQDIPFLLDQMPSVVTTSDA